MTGQSPNYLSDKIEMRKLPDKGGYGVFALQPFQKDEVLPEAEKVLYEVKRYHLKYWQCFR